MPGLRSFLVLFLLAASLSPVLPADDSKLTIYMAGKPIASETYSIHKADGKVDVDGSGNADFGMMKIDIQKFEVITDDKFQPLSAVARGTLGKASMATTTTFTDGKAKNEIDTGQGPATKEDDVRPDVIVVNYPLPLFPWSVLAMRADLKATGPQEFRAYVIGKAEVPVTVTVKGKEDVEFADKTVSLNRIGAMFTPPNGQPTAVDVWIDDDRKIVKLSVPIMNVEAYQAGFDRKAPPTPPAPPPSTAAPPPAGAAPPPTATPPPANPPAPADPEKKPQPPQER